MDPDGEKAVWLDWVTRAIELTGVGAIVLGVVLALVAGGVSAVRGGGPEGIRVLRHNLGRAIAVGLELLVAADILRTVTEDPSLRDVAILGVIVLVRTFLSFTLHVETEGHWPWQAKSRRGKD